MKNKRNSQEENRSIFQLKLEEMVYQSAEEESEVNMKKILAAKETEDFLAQRSVVNEEIYQGLSQVYLRKVRSFPVLSREREQKLAAQMRKRDKELAKKAREEFINSNLKLVIYIARRYLGQGLSFLDLVQEGNIGLLAAVDRFDRKRGCRFATFARWWIRQGILRAIYERGHTIRLPVALNEEINRLIKAERELLVLKGVSSLAEIATMTGFSEKKVAEIQESKRIKQTLSLNTKLNDDSEDELIDFITEEHLNFGSQRELSFKDPAELYELRIRLKRLMDKLSPKEFKILCLRIGYDFRKRKHCGEQTLEEIGRKFNVTKQRIQQLYKGILTKMRNSDESRLLKEFLFSP